MVVWKAVSNTPTSFAHGMTSRKQPMASRYGPLCAGATNSHSRMAARTSSVSSCTP